MKNRLTYLVLLAAAMATVASSCSSDVGVSAQVQIPTLAPTETASQIKIWPSPTAQSQGEKGCIPPIASVAFPANLAPVLPLKEETPIPPSEEWQAISDLPVVGQNVGKLVVRSNSEVWLVYSAPRSGLWVYHVDSNRWKQYSSIQGKDVIINDLFLTPEDGLWGIGYVKTQGSGSAGPFFFSQYDRTTDQFRFSPIGADILKDYNIATIKQDSKGTLWLMAQKKGQQFPNLLIEGAPAALFNVDLITKKIQQYRDFPWPARFALGPDGSVWTVVDNSRPHLQRFIPATNESRNYPALPPAMSGINVASDVRLLYFDRLGHLWVDSRGWVDFDNPDLPVWYQLIRPAVFLTDRSEVDTKFIWLLPDEIYQSTNGMYWFRTFYGLVSLDPASAEWCKFTNGKSPFFEDPQRDLWIAVFGKLYKHPLQP